MSESESEDEADRDREGEGDGDGDGDGDGEEPSPLPPPRDRAPGKRVCPPAQRLSEAPPAATAAKAAAKGPKAPAREGSKGVKITRPPAASGKKPAATAKKPKAEKLPPVPREPPGWETTEEGKLVGIFGATAETLEKAQDRYETDRKDLVGRRVIATDEDGDWTAVLVQFMPQETKDSRRDRDPEFYNKAWYKLHYYESSYEEIIGLPDDTVTVDDRQPGVREALCKCPICTQDGRQLDGAPLPLQTSIARPRKAKKGKGSARKRQRR